MSSNPARIIQVVIASPLRQFFDYLPAEGKLAKDYLVGSRVQVPFGRRNITGIVIGHSDSSAIAANKLKAILSSLDSVALLDQEMLTLGRWMSQYYHHPLGDAILNLLPTTLRKGGAYDAYTQQYWQISQHGLGLDDQALSRAPKQQSLLNRLRQQALDEHSHAAIPEQQLTAEGHSRPTALALAKKALILQSSQGYYPSDCQSLLQGEGNDVLPTLNTEQRNADQLIEQQLNHFATVLLEGITGSGKTEVYLRAIEKVLTQQQQALVLVPEIGLTPQTIQRFVARFKVPIAIFHSGLNDRERLAAWTASKEGRARIIIGTRSAVFTPTQNLGIIIIDEEHDNSYKQQDGIRYSARDIAIILAQKQKLPVILGSATPSLETYANVNANKYRHVVLQQRAGNAQPPAIELVDIRRQALHQGLSDQAISAINRTLAEGKQAMVFVNRRGFAPLLMCHDCGWQAQCSQCDARLTLHQRPASLRCHHCDFRSAVPSHCPQCQSKNLMDVGQGTQRSAEALSDLFPQHTILRVDRDSTQGKQAMGAQIERINRGQPAILVGTQMLAKGHHFAALSLVVVLDVDQGLYSPDFRSAEKTLQLLTQVAGRAGRSDTLGRVLIQTHLPDHPLLINWQQHSYQGVKATLMAERELYSLPPITHMAILRADSTKPQQAMQVLSQLLRDHPANNHCQILGPLATIMEKRAGRHRAQLIIKSPQRKALHNTIEQFVQQFEAAKLPSSLRWSVDIDPQDVI